MQTLNIYSKSDDWRARRLSNFPADPFILDGEEMASVEGFIQGTKFPEGHPARKQAFQMEALLATKELVLTHDLGSPDDSALPATVFCAILTQIREEAIQARK